MHGQNREWREQKKTLSSIAMLWQEQKCKRLSWNGKWVHPYCEWKGEASRTKLAGVVEKLESNWARVVKEWKKYES